MLGILDIIIAIFLIYALFASLVSGINELIVQTLAMRGRILFEGIAVMLGELPKETGSIFSRVFGTIRRRLGFISTQNAHLTQLLYTHPLIDTLSPPGSSKPSYIPPSIFARTLVQVLTENNGSLETLRTSLQDRTKPLNKLLGPMFDEANEDLEKFKIKIADHYNAVMDRTSGWYKRRAQFMMFVIAFGLAGTFNVDSVYIVQQMQKNPAQVEELVTLAANYTENTDTNLENKTSSSDQSTDITPDEKLLQDIKALNVEINDFRNLGLPVGWVVSSSVAERIATEQNIQPNPDDAKSQIQDNFPLTLLPEQNNFFLVVAGWMITALAGALGAPFWFDAISKLFAVRGSGKKPE